MHGRDRNGAKYAKGVTFIDQLPELADLERGGGHYQQYTRNAQLPPPPHMSQSSHVPPPRMPNDIIPPELAINYQKHIRPKQQLNESSGMALYNEPISHQEIEPEPYRQFDNPDDGLSCRAIANHVQDCPVCSKFHGGADKTIYIIIIVVLAIVTLLLLKKVLDV